MNIFEDYCDRYDDWYEDHKFAYLSELEALKKVVPQSARGLEIGLGTGRFAAPLNITLGIDPSHKMLEKAIQRGINVRWGYGEDLPFTSDSFDYAAILITLCFVQDPLLVLKEARRVIKKDGQLIIAIIDKDSYLGKIYQKTKSVFYKKARFFNVKELENLLKQSGFNKFSYYQTLFTLPDKMISVEKTEEGFGKGGYVIINSS